MKQSSNLETKVGIFLLLGIGLICTLIILFGEMPDLFKPSYNLTVRFPNASGLLKGSDVYLSGALIGKVTTNPLPIPDTQKVEVQLKIDKNVGIRRDATYVIGSAGLLGDKYVEVRPVVYPDKTPEENKALPVYDGELIEGEIPTDVNTLMTSAQPLIEKANDIAARLDNVMKKLDDQVLSGTSTDDLKETIAKLRKMVDNGDTMVSNANDLLAEAKAGKGVVGRLLNDKQLGDNVAAFIANLKAHGPIFYKDDTVAPKGKEDEAPPRKKNK